MIEFIVWFNKFYTKDKRVFLHLLMWLLFAITIELGLLITYRLSFLNSLFFLIRSLIGNAIVFYFFFYFIVPNFLLNKKILIAILLTGSSFILWQVNDFLFIFLANKYANIENELLNSQIKQEVEKGFYNVFSLPKIIGNISFILYSISPVFCIKIIVDMVKELYKFLQLEREKINLEVDFLKSQLNPHFLFNILNSIYNLILKKDEKAADVVLDLSNMMRYTLYESNEERVLLVKEMDFLEHYVNLEKVKQHKSTIIDFNCNVFQMENKTIAPLLMFPFVENAFKHGLNTSLKNAWLYIDTGIEGDVFYFNIRNSKSNEDNGEKLTESIGGIGVANSKRRLSMIYPERHELNIQDNPSEYNVQLKIQLD